MDERPAKKRKVRKGTRSCWQCRKRKIRCEFADDDEQTCAGCKVRGTSCLSQEFIDDEPTGPPERGVAQRLARLEELMVKLADKIGPETSTEKTTTPASSLNESAPTSESLPPLSHRVQTVESPVITPSPANPTQPQPVSESSHVTLKNERICKELYSMFPSKKDTKIIIESSRGPVFVLILFYSYQDIIEGKSPPTATLSDVPDVSKHPAILAKHLLQLTICLQQLPPCFNPSQKHLGLTHSIQDTMAEWVAAASLVTSNDELVGSAEGLQCLILQGFYLINSGNLRKAWLAMRRALSLAQLIGIERNGSRPLKSCDPATDPATIPSSHQLWYRINFCDRYLSLLLGLPAGTQDNSFFSEPFIANDTPMEKLEKKYTVISLRIIDRNRAPPHEAYAITQSIDCEIETAAKTMGNAWWEIPPVADYTDTTTQMGVMSHLMLQIHHHSLLILLHLPYMLRNSANNRYDYSKNTCLESSRAVLRRCVIFRTANNAVFSCRHIDYSSLMAAMTLLLGHLTRPPGVRDDEWCRQRVEDRALAQTTMEKMEELASLNHDKLSGESAEIIKQLLPIIDCCNDCLNNQPGEDWNVRLSIPYLGTVNINNSLNQNAQPHLHTVDLSHSQLPTPSNTTTVSPASFPANQETSTVTSVDNLLGQDFTPSGSGDVYGGFGAECPQWQCPGITAEAGDWAFQGVDTAYWSLLNSDIPSLTWTPAYWRILAMSVSKPKATFPRIYAASLASVPGRCCWPSESSWEALDLTLDGNLVKSEPIAQSCYDGPAKDLAECARVSKLWSDQDFQTSNPIGRPYPYNITCAPVDHAAGQIPTSCSLGSLPTYAVNATTRADINSTLSYARQHNIRLVVASTGHDLLGRSDGYGSLEIWLRHYRRSIDFQQTYVPANGCRGSNWTGSAIHIDGAYQWRDVYKVAKANNVIAVGGGSASPSANGGWSSGGGHGPATRDYGLGADQILEAEVMLADGRVVVASHCENEDLFRALRGGGPGYGIVLSTTVKTYPNVNAVTVHRLTLTPLRQIANNSDLLDAVSMLFFYYPSLNRAGFAGYAYWSRNSPTVFVGNSTSGYTHNFWMIGKTKQEVDRSCALCSLNEYLVHSPDRGVSVDEDWAEYGDYWSFYEAESGLYDPVGDTAILTSRMMDPSVAGRYDDIRAALEVFSGAPGEFVSNVALLVSGGKVFEDAGDPTSGVHPAWRRSPYVLVAGRGVSRTASNAERKAVQDDITFVKGAAVKKLSPGTGGYMNEGDRHDPDYIQTFYGDYYAAHLAAKRKYDPDHVFYCPTCVGAEAFVETPDGPLCKL
ncbi:hypothetical protein CkaCkLH20_00528 [Colletotrichum karsti]|uniref:Zn(2)-C6 fungal-type domain-containing protein n=1 Tax=Colletotrichum karsti TaxID=1095194 RepID=A0A9P6IFL7_9PEZI|nr:uncharacterized protein CkaCkLH20_00528 [Colletotrichum karsti]KAF9882492.1 hypothetical protein CkaCkLH20_00528 [Colletotrichum karsti]